MEVSKKLGKLNRSVLHSMFAKTLLLYILLYFQSGDVMTGPQGAPPPEKKPHVLSQEDMEKCKDVMIRFAKCQKELGGAERSWHVAAVEYYKIEAEVARLDADIRKKYGMGPHDVFDPPTGRIVRRQ